MLSKMDRVSKTILLVWAAMLLQQLFSIGAGVFLGEESLPAWADFLYSFLVQAICFLLPTLLYLKRVPSFRKGLRATPLELDWKELLLLALAALFGLVFMSGIIQLFAYLLRFLQIPILVSYMPDFNTTPLFIAALATVALMPGLSEELLFRGTLQQALAPYGTRLSVVLTTVIFALMHGLLTGLPAHLIVGFVLCFLFYSTGSIDFAVLYHMLHNGFSLLMQVLFANIETEQVEEAAAASASILTPETVISTIITIAIFGALWIVLLRRLIRHRTARGYKPQWVGKDQAQKLPRLAVFLIIVTIVFQVLNYYWTLQPYLGQV